MSRLIIIITLCLVPCVIYRSYSMKMKSYNRSICNTTMLLLSIYVRISTASETIIKDNKNVLVVTSGFEVVSSTSTYRYCQSKQLCLQSTNMQYKLLVCILPFKMYIIRRLCMVYFIFHSFIVEQTVQKVYTKPLRRKHIIDVQYQKKRTKRKQTEGLF